MSEPSAIPADRPYVIPHLTLGARLDGGKGGASAALAWYAEAFGAVETARQEMPDGSGRLLHAEMKLGDGLVLLADDFPEMTPDNSEFAPAAVGTTTVTMHKYVEDCDAMFAQAMAAGATAVMEPWDAFWGDRYCQVADPFGHRWSFASHQRDLSEEEIAESVAFSSGDW